MSVRIRTGLFGAFICGAVYGAVWFAYSHFGGAAAFGVVITAYGALMGAIFPRTKP